MRNAILGSGTIFRVQSWECGAVVPSAVHEIVGIAWPQDTGSTASGRADILCVGPTDWLVTAVDPDPTILLRWLDEAFEGSAFRATNLSQAYIRVQIDGPEVRDLLAKGCSLDLYPPLFSPGRAARTRFAGLALILRCTGDSTFELIVTQSHTDFLVAWLADAALEFSEPAI